MVGAEPAASGVDSFACDITDAGAVAELADPGMAYYSWAKWGAHRLVEREAAAWGVRGAVPPAAR